MKNKEANFQILKIAAMLMIVSHHLVAKNAFNIDTQVIGITGNKLALQILGNNAFIGNNLFFLVSAWFLSKKPDEKVDLNYSARSCWKIEKTVLFYGLSMCIGAFIFGGGQSKTLLLQSVFPTLTGMWWYPTTYMIFLLIWPFYHKALMGFSVDVLKQFTTVMLVIWSVSTIVPFVNWGANNLLAFLMLYSIVIMIKRMGITYENHKSECKALILIPYIVAVISIIVLDLIGKKITSAAEYSCYFMRGNYRPVSMMVSADYLKGEMEPCHRKKKYVLFFCIKPSVGLREKAEQYANKYGYELVTVGGRIKERFDPRKHPEYGVGPKEFLGLINGAQCVFTNSFHGMAISVALHRDFFVEFSSDTNSRLVNLTEMLGMENRVVRDKTPLEEKIDYTHADEVLQQERKVSMQYLEKVLQ